MAKKNRERRSPDKVERMQQRVEKLSARLSGVTFAKVEEKESVSIPKKVWFELLKDVAVSGAAVSTLAVNLLFQTGLVQKEAKADVPIRQEAGTNVPADDIKALLAQEDTEGSITKDAEGNIIISIKKHPSSQTEGSSK